MMIKTLIQFHLKQQKGRVFFHKIDLDFVDVNIMNLLAEEPYKIRALCEAIGCERTEIAKRVNKLLLADFITKSDVASDRRMTLISLTSQGAQAYKLVLEKIDALLSQTVEGLTIKEEKAVLSYLEKLNRSVNSIQ